MPEPHTRETIKLGGLTQEILTLIRERPFEVLTGITIMLVLLGTTIQQFIIIPLTAHPAPPPVVSASATLPTLTQAYPHAFTRAVSVYNQPDREHYRGPVETGRRYALVARSGSAWYLLDIQGSGAGWVPGEFLAQPTPALLPDLATPVVQIVEVPVVVTATPRPIVAPVVPAAPAPVVPVAMPTATPLPPVIPPSPVPEFPTLTPTYPILIRGEPRYMPDIVTPSPTHGLDVLVNDP